MAGKALEGSVPAIVFWERPNRMEGNILTKVCKRCGAIVEEEADGELKSEYPYYCPGCDENLYSFETTEVPETGGSMDKDDKNFNGDSIPGKLVKRAIRKIYNAGGCDAGDEYSEGYDAAIMLALDILLKETGCALEDALEEGEDKEAVQSGSKYL